MPTTTTVLGTSAYMAPEAFRGDVSVKLDTFSYGVVSLLCLTNSLVAVLVYLVYNCFDLFDVHVTVHHDKFL
jgi:serine/threonine protein kinase